MKALMIEGAGSCRFHDVADPRPGDGEVLVAVRHVGLCGTDLGTFKGANPLARLPRIPGHEIGGEIAAVGANVPAGYAPGKRVIVVPYTSCGACTSCRAGRVNACRNNRTLGVQQDGGLSEFIALRHEKLILNDVLPARHLALVEPMSVGFHAVGRGRVAAGETVAVIGCGMIGMGAIAGAAARGARVVAIDVSAGKAGLARAYGAETFIDSGTEDVAARIAELTGGDGVAVAIEAVGLPVTFNQAVEIACFCGRVVNIGYAKEPTPFKTQTMNLKELDILGSRNALAEDFRAVIRYLEARGQAPDDLISRVFPFAEAEAALPYWDAERAATIKILIEV